jgi:integrase
MEAKKPNVNFHLTAPDINKNRFVFMLVKIEREIFKCGIGAKIGPYAKIKQNDGNARKTKSENRTITGVKSGPDDHVNRIMRDFEIAFETAWESGARTAAEMRGKMAEYKAGLKEPKIEQEPIAAAGKTDFFKLFEIMAEDPKKSEDTRINRTKVLDRVKRYKPNVRLRDITLEWLETYRNHIRENNPDIMASTMNGYFRVLKTVLDEAKKKGLTTSKSPFKSKTSDGDFEMEKVYDGDSDAVALTGEELRKLVNLTGLPPILDRCKDIWLISAFTGLRSKDVKALKPTNVVNGKLIVRTSKTKAVFSMDMPHVVRRIYEKYGNQFPKGMTTSDMNRRIKEVCKIAGLNETGRMDTDKAKNDPLWMHVQGHSGRRTFVTIRLHEKNIPAAVVMEWTLHKKPETTMRYSKPRIGDIDKIAADIDSEYADPL